MISQGARLTFIDEDIRKHNPTVEGLTALMDGECIIRIETIRGGLKYIGTLDGAQSRISGTDCPLVQYRIQIRLFETVKRYDEQTKQNSGVLYRVLRR